MREYKLSIPPRPMNSVSYFVNGINNLGQIVGQVVLEVSGQENVPAWWDNRVAPCHYDGTFADSAPQSTGSQFLAINDNGYAAGILDSENASASLPPVACLLNSPAPGDASPVPNGNDVGDISGGGLAINNGNLLLLEAGITVQISGSQYTRVNSGVDLTGAQGMNNRGDVVGGNANGAFFFDGEQGTLAPLISGGLCLYDINDNRLAVGYTTTSSGIETPFPFYMDLSAPQSEWFGNPVPLQRSPAAGSYPDPRIAVNNSGMIVFNTFVIDEEGIHLAPFYFQGPMGPGEPAPQLIAGKINDHIQNKSATDPVTLIEARDINDSGEIVGLTTTGCFVATPVSPASGSHPGTAGLVLAVEGILEAVGQLKAQIARVEGELETIMSVAVEGGFR